LALNKVRHRTQPLLPSAEDGNPSNVQTLLPEERSLFHFIHVGKKNPKVEKDGLWNVVESTQGLGGAPLTVLAA
jgi:hypothetical protein